MRRLEPLNVCSSPGEDQKQALNVFYLLSLPDLWTCEDSCLADIFISKGRTRPWLSLTGIYSNFSSSRTAESSTPSPQTLQGPVRFHRLVLEDGARTEDVWKVEEERLSGPRSPLSSFFEPETLNTCGNQRIIWHSWENRVSLFRRFVFVFSVLRIWPWGCCYWDKQFTERNFHHVMEKELLCIWKQWTTGHLHPTDHDLHCPQQGAQQRAGPEQLLPQQRSAGEPLILLSK